MMTLPFPLSEAAVQALGWTLLHNLWQGTVIVLLLLLLLPRLLTAKARYRAAYGGLLAMLAAAVITFFCFYQPNTGAAAVQQIAVETGMTPDQLAVGAEITDESVRSQISTWLDQYHPALVGVWLLGFGIFLLRLAGGLFGIHNLRRSAFPLSGAHWAVEQLSTLAARLPYRQSVDLLESAMVHVPLTVGWLKPVILLPLGMVNQLSPAEVEAILAHELAHIARRDWLFNLLQAFIEALFYYHPAVWWLSALVRRERENCCDDVAIALTGNRLVFAKALVQVQEMTRERNRKPVLALGASGATAWLRRRPLLLERIQRILNQQHKKSQLMEKFIASSLLAALMALWGAQSREVVQLTDTLGQIASAPLAWFEGAPDQEPALAPLPVVDADSVPKGKKARQTQKIVQENDEGRVEMELQDGLITRLNINGQDVPPGEYEKHKELTDGLREDMAPPAPIAAFPGTPAAPEFYFWSPAAPPAAFSPLSPISPMAPMAPMAPEAFSFVPGAPGSITTDKDEQGNTVIRLLREGAPTEIIVKGDEVWIDGKKMENGQSFNFDAGSPAFIWNGADGQSFYFPEARAFQFEPGLSQEDIARMQEMQAREMAEARKQMERERKVMEKDRKRQEKEMRKHRKEIEINERENMRRASEEMRRAELEMERSQQEMQRAMAEMQRAQIEASRSGNFGEAMRRELQRDGLLPDPKHYSLQLSSTELIVNGQKQSSALHRKYLDLYRQKTGQELGPGSNINIVENRD
ncbi:MAG: M48 family metalloprotease [Saprospiraceae bacterium]|nr:M48 family metalloprotease [Saprospiraceae bacterium]